MNGRFTSTTAAVAAPATPSAPRQSSRPGRDIASTYSASGSTNAPGYSLNANPSPSRTPATTPRWASERSERQLWTTNTAATAQATTGRSQLWNA
jgi:hypothetical protein